MDERGLLRLGAACSALAGLVHVVNAPEHVSEWWGYGLFFLSASVAQLWFAGGLLTDGQAREPGLDAAVAQAREDTRGFVMLGLPRGTWYALGVAGNASIVALYAVTRTVGVPQLGPDAGQVEPVTPLGLASKLFELVLIGALLLLSRRDAVPRPSPSGS